jgi:hypothetical protein
MTSSRRIRGRALFLSLEADLELAIQRLLADPAKCAALTRGKKTARVLGCAISARAVLQALIKLEAAEHAIQVSLAEIADWADLSPRSVTDAIAVLKALGVLRVTELGWRRPCRYELRMKALMALPQGRKGRNDCVASDGCASQEQSGAQPSRATTSELQEQENRRGLAASTSRAAAAAAGLTAPRPAKKKPGGKAERRPHELREAVKYHAACFERRTGERLVIHFPRDCARLKPVLRVYGADGLRKYQDAFFAAAPDDWWVDQQKFGIGHFIGAIDALVGRNGGSRIATTRPRSRTAGNEAAGREALQLHAQLMASRQL